MKLDPQENKQNERMMNSSIAPPDSPVHTEQKKLSTSKQDKQLLHEFEHHVKEIRAQLAEQLKCVGERTDTQIAVLSEFEEWCRRRGELEAEYAKNLDKLSKSTMQRHKTEKNRREQWSQHTVCSAWQQLVDDAKDDAQQRQLIAELYQKVLVSSISSRYDDLAKISKKCREIGALSHSEINRVLTELHTAMKTYQLCHTELSGVERKLRIAEDEKRRYEEANPGKYGSSRKHKSLSKYLVKREEKYDAVRSKCTKARNEYLMCVKAANAALHRFFAQDLSYLIDCMDLGMDFWMKNILNQLIEARKRIAQREMDSLADLGTLRSSFDSKGDKQRYFEAHHATFMLPKQFDFRPQVGDQVCEVSAERGLAVELEQRHKQIDKRLDDLRFETDEVWKSLEAAEKRLHQLYSDNIEDMSKWRNDLMVTYQYYLKKFEYFLLNGNLIERLEARSQTIGEALAREAGLPTRRESIPNAEERKKKVRRIGVAPDPNKPRPKLFGGSLEEYVEATGEGIPLVVTSSIGYLSRYSMRNQGLFRVSGSQSEINRFKEAYEQGEDAFSDLIDGSESNSVAGVLKLYLRELREPLFPIFLFDQFTDCAKAESSQDFIKKTRELICKLPVCNVLLLRFLFGFLSHLCEYADENMMEPHNLAICFGPTLLPIPEGKDQVFFHNYVNELVRYLIIHWAEVFPNDLDGPSYDKYAAGPDPPMFADEGDALSEDEEGLRNGTNGTSSGDQMLDSTYEMSLSTDMDIPREPTQSTLLASPRTECQSQPSMSSRSSNRSGLDEYLRRMSEDVSPVLRTDMPHRIANEISAKFASREKEKSSTIETAPRPIWEAERSISQASSTLSHHSFPTVNVSVPSSSTARPPMTSLRDQLHHFQREKRDNCSKVYPLTDPLSKTSKFGGAKGDTVLDARVGMRENDCHPIRPTLFEATYGKLELNGDIELKRGISEQQSSLVGANDPPDVVACSSARRAQSELTRRQSPPLDELAAALQATSFD